GDGVIDAWFTAHFFDLHAGFPERESGFCILTAAIIQKDVVGDPSVEEIFALVSRHKRAHLIAHDGLQEMREPCNRECVLQLRSQACAGSRVVIQVLLRLLAGLCTDKCSLILTFVMTERNKSQP